MKPDNVGNIYGQDFVLLYTFQLKENRMSSRVKGSRQISEFMRDNMS